MRHRKAYSKLNRDKDHRKALKRNQLKALFKYEKIVTTVAKAKLLRIHADKIITLAKKGDLASRRLVLKEIQDKDLVHKIFSEIAPKFEKREGGYTRVLRFRDRRGDGAPLSVVELVQEELKVKIKKKKIKAEKQEKDNKTNSEEKKIDDKKEESVVEEKDEKTVAENDMESNVVEKNEGEKDNKNTDK